VHVVNRRRLLLAGAVAAVVVIALVIAWPWVRAYTGMARPDQFYRSLSPPAEIPARHVLGVAHNAGNHAATTAAALKYGADVIEIDVITARGRLVAGRALPWPLLAERVFQGQTLATAWQHAAAAEIIKLDLQQTDRDLLNSLVKFLDERPDHPAMVSTRNADAIEYLRPRLPAAVTLLFSVPFPHAVTRIQSNPALTDAVGGISVFQGLVDTNLVRWAHDHNLLVLAWTVNDGERLNQLLHLGVDGITTGNLAILQALAR
jgi:glycerophosphoryl diester phosphodiesterase